MDELFPQAKMVFPQVLLSHDCGTHLLARNLVEIAYILVK